MALIIDTIPFILESTKKVVSEDINGIGKVCKVGGRLQYANKLNANGRVYPKSVLEAAVNELQGEIKARAVMGEYMHPADTKINLDRVSHVITNLWMEGNEVFGECEILDGLPFGNSLKTLFDKKIRVGISSRGVGDLEASIFEGKECSKVLPGYKIITFDIVSEPSVYGSYLTMKESKDSKVTEKTFHYSKSNEKKILEEISKIFLNKSKII